MSKLLIIALIFATFIGAVLFIDFQSFFNWASKEYMPRRACMRGDLVLINTHLYSDWAIAISYITLPVSLIWLALKRKDLMHKGTFVIFAAFILFCGLTHVMNIVAMYKTFYRWDAIFKILCAIASIGAAFTFPFVVSQVMKMPTSKAFEDMTEQLKKTRRELELLKQLKKDE